MSALTDVVLHAPIALLMAQIVVVVLLARFLAAALRLVHQPPVIAEILAGIALGPSLLGAVAPEVTATLFPPDSLGSLGLVAQLGLVLFMLLVGLEFDPALLKGHGRSAVVISQAGIAVPFALGAGTAWLLHATHAPEGVAPLPFALFLGVAMSVTAFPVLARILVETDLLRTRVGMVTIAAAAVDDVTAWCLLAFVAAIARADELAGAAGTVLGTLAYLAVMLGPVRVVLARAGRNALTAESVGQGLVTVVLMATLVSALVTEAIGVHALFGAFLVGTVLPKEGAFAHALADRIEDVAVVLLLPLFFTYSGLRTEIGLVETAGDWAVCAALLGVAFLGKAGAGYAAARWSGLDRRESAVLGILMNTRGLMEIVVLNIGLDLGVLTPKLFTMMVIVAIVTTVATTPLLRWVHRPATSSPAPPPPVPGTVLIPIADGRSGPGLLDIAAAVGATEVVALHLTPTDERISVVIDAAHPEAGASETTALRPLLEHAEARGVPVRALSLPSVQLADDIVRVAHDQGAGLVLLGWHRPVLSGERLGGVVHEVLSITTRPVGVFFDRGVRSPRAVLALWSGSAADRLALDLALRLAARGARLTVLRACAADGTAPAFPVDLPPTAIVLDADAGSAADRAVAVASEGHDLVLVGLGPVWGIHHRRFGLVHDGLLYRTETSMLVCAAPAGPA